MGGVAVDVLLHKRVVVADVRGLRVSSCPGDDQQPEFIAHAKTAGLEGPVIRNQDLFLCARRDRRKQGERSRKKQGGKAEKRRATKGFHRPGRAPVYGAHLWSGMRVSSGLAGGGGLPTVSNRIGPLHPLRAKRRW